MMRSFKTNAVELGKLPKQNPIREPDRVGRMGEHEIGHQTIEGLVDLLGVEVLFGRGLLV